MAAPNKPNDQHPATDTPWHAGYPKPKNQSPATVTRQEILGMLLAAEKPQKDLVLIDLRRTDYEVIQLLKNHRVKAHEYGRKER